MSNVLILTDSTVDLDPQYIIDNDIQQIPLFVRFEDEVYRDGIDINANDLYHKVESSKDVARSTGLRSGDFHNAFNKFIKRGFDIVYIGIGSNLSSSIQSALIAKQELETKKVYIVDSKSISAGLGILVMRAVDLKNQGKSGASIKKALDELVPRIHLYYMLSDLELLSRTYRIRPISFFFANLFKTKPIITMINDRIEMIHHPMGTIDKAMLKFVKLIQKKTRGQKVDHLVITYSCEEAYAKKGIDLLTKRLHPRIVASAPIGCVLGAQVGRNAFGIAYLQTSD
ncbi:MAG: DegV family protein [Acholeplasmataceae bacterium]